jgi:hypothetical protein
VTVSTGASDCDHEEVRLDLLSWITSLVRSTRHRCLYFGLETLLQEGRDLRPYFCFVSEEKMTTSREAKELPIMNLLCGVATAVVSTVQIVCRADDQRRNANILELVRRQIG